MYNFFFRCIEQTKIKMTTNIFFRLFIKNTWHFYTNGGFYGYIIIVLT